jgi:NADP-dependent 3-hydroxy acid dehydrogenase YdfG
MRTAPLIRQRLKGNCTTDELLAVSRRRRTKLALEGTIGLLPLVTDPGGDLYDRPSCFEKPCGKLQPPTRQAASLETLRRSASYEQLQRGGSGRFAPRLGETRSTNDHARDGNMELSGKAILITGASRGIGSAVAKRLSSAGADVALCGRDKTALEATKLACKGEGVRTALLPGDIRDVVYVAGLVENAFGALGRLDAVVNSAGVFVTGPAQDADLAEWDQVLDVNFRAWMHLTRRALPILMCQPESAVVNICSIAGRTTFAGGGIYTATKHAVHAWSSCLFDDVRDKGVKVCAIYPGYVNTDMAARVPGDHDNMIQPDDVAQTVEFALRFPGTSCPTEIVLRPQRPL